MRGRERTDFVYSFFRQGKKHACPHGHPRQDVDEEFESKRSGMTRPGLIFAFPGSENRVFSIIERLNELWNGFGWILQIGIQHDRFPPLTLRKSGDHGSVLPDVLR